MANYTVQPETNKIIKEYAEQIGIDAEKALDKLIQTAASRRAALKKYQTNNPRVPKAKKEKKAKAAKGTSLAKKTAKPKAKKAPKAKQVRAIDVVSGEESPL
jgi:hypothetical protein